MKNEHFKVLGWKLNFIQSLGTKTIFYLFLGYSFGVVIEIPNSKKFIETTSEYG